MFSFLLIDWLSFGEARGGVEIGCPRSRGGRILDVDGQGGQGVLKIRQFSWTSSLYHPLSIS